MSFVMVIEVENLHSTDINSQVTTIAYLEKKEKKDYRSHSKVVSTHHIERTMMLSRVRVAAQSTPSWPTKRAAPNSTVICVQSLRPDGLGNSPKRFFSVTAQSKIEDYFPPPRTKGVKQVKTAWTHPV